MTDRPDVADEAVPAPTERSARKRAKRKRERPLRCLNCETELTGDWCHHCGQNNRHDRLEVREVFGTAMEHLFDLDVPLFRTFGALTRNPGRLCRTYAGGRRRRYSNPIRYCFLAAALYVLITGLLGISSSQGANEWFGVDQTPATQRVTPRENEGSLTEEEKRARISAYIAEHATSIIETSLHIVTILCMPFVALALWWSFRSSGYTYAEHLSFTLFVYGHALYLTLLIVLLGAFRFSYGFLLLQIAEFAYVLWAAKVFYQRGIIRTVIGLIPGVMANWIAAITFGTIAVFVWIAWLFASGTIWERIEQIP